MGIHKECCQELRAKPWTLLGIPLRAWTAFKARLKRADLTQADMMVECEGLSELGGGTYIVIRDTTPPVPTRVYFEIDDEWNLTCDYPKARITFCRGENGECAGHSHQRMGLNIQESDTVPTPIWGFRRTLDYHVNRRDLLADTKGGRFKTMNQHTLSWLPI